MHRPTCLNLFKWVYSAWWWWLLLDAMYKFLTITPLLSEHTAFENNVTNNTNNGNVNNNILLTATISPDLQTQKAT